MATVTTRSVGRRQINQNTLKTEPRKSNRIHQQNKCSPERSTSEDVVIPRTPRKCKSPETGLNLTPEKQRKCNTGDKSTSPCGTPSTLLDSLSLTTPETQNHRNTYRENVYRSAKKALYSSMPSKMPARDKELTEIEDFISSHVVEERSGSLYISGPPGTGKTAAVNLIIDRNSKLNQLKPIYINCTALKTSGWIYTKIIEVLGIKVSSRSDKKDKSSVICNYLQNCKKMILLILDEIDQLESSNQSILYSIFEWPSIPHSHLILIGIANALDLTDRILPRLQASCEIQLKLVHFAPYTKKQIIEILTKRLEDGGALQVFSATALQMLAGKVAAVSGDVRRALDIGRRVVDLVERNRECDVLKSIENCRNDQPQKIVDLHQVVAVLNNVYGTTQKLLTNDTADTNNEDDLPLQQKITICALLVALKKTNNKNVKDVTIGRLHEIYSKICLKRNLLAVDHGEFVSVCQLIETKGIIKLNKKKEMRMSRINLIWNEGEIFEALKDKQLLSSILQEKYDF